MIETTVKHLLAVSQIAPLLIFDDAMQIVAANPALDKLAGYDDGGLISKKVSLIDSAKLYVSGDTLDDISIESSNRKNV